MCFGWLGLVQLGLREIGMDVSVPEANFLQLETLSVFPKCNIIALKSLFFIARD